MTRADRSRFLIRRPWTRAEKRVVWHGFFGRLAIAVEPILGALVFAGISTGVMLRVDRGIVDRVVIASIFILGFLGFAVYAVWLMVSPTRALLQTRRPIYIVDGFVRRRGPDEHSDPGSAGYVAVLDEHRLTACEWPANGHVLLTDSTFAALVEFSEYGGIHTIDGRSTGAVPTNFRPLGIGLASALRVRKP